MLGFVHPLSAGSFLSTYGMSFGFDLLHALGNFAFAFALGPAFVTMLRRYRQRFSFEAAGDPAHAEGLGGKGGLQT